MTEETIVGIYDTAARAEAAAADLRSAGIANGAITVHMQSATDAGAATSVSTTATAGREAGFWAGLFGGEPEHGTAVYDRSLQNGSAVVTVRLDSAHVDHVMTILERHNPIDIEERAASYGLGQTATAGAGTLQLSEEQLSVGKRVVNRGGTRVRRYVVETPVEQTVSLHEEKVTLQRRAVVDGSPTADSFSAKTIELTETAEEAVIAKTARVYEEVGLHKQASERVETIRDTVRKEEVEIEQIPAVTATTTRVSNTSKKV